jgi:hypothetical protein
MTLDEARHALLEAMADRDTFRQLVLANVAPTEETPAYRKIVVRPAAPDAGEPFRADWYTDTQHTTRDVPAGEVSQILALPFRNAHLQAAMEDWHVRVSKRGSVLLKRGKPSQPGAPVHAKHDRVKQHRLPGDRPHPLLQALGVQTSAGKVRSARRDKFVQINQFLEILATLAGVTNAKGPLHLVDCGCGAAYLTFAAHHYLRDVLGLRVTTVGVDANAKLIGRCNALRDALDYADVTFVTCRIADYIPAAAPTIVLSLHACDTATDEALALAVRHRARVILAAPCCQHELRDQLANDAMQALLRHGVLRTRTADLVTDAARAALLRVAGYRCDVIEFVSPEHTGKNLMLRAERRSSKSLPGAEEDYAALKQAWHITPALERMLREPAH